MDDQPRDRDERLVAEALQKGILSPDEGDAALAEARAAGRPVDQVMVDKGLISPRTAVALNAAVSPDAKTLAPTPSLVAAALGNDSKTLTPDSPTLSPQAKTLPPDGVTLDPGLVPATPLPADSTRWTSDAPLREAQTRVGLPVAGGAVFGDFELGDKLGEGGMGAVHKAVQRSLHREVAVKLLPARFASDRRAAERFLREARVAAAVNHPNVITVFGCGEEGGHLYMAMELVKGGDAHQLARKAGGRLPEQRALEVIRDATKGLAAIARAGLVHRDIKPANIFIDETGTAKLADLGLARSSSDEDRVTQTGVAVGTPAFMSPEQLDSREDLDVRSDIYALGATLFELVTGDPPYSGSLLQIMKKVANDPLPDPRTINPDVSIRCRELIQKATAKERADRHQTAQELLEAVEGALSARKARDVRQAGATKGAPPASSPAATHAAPSTPRPAAPRPASAPAVTATQLLPPEPASKAPVVLGAVAVVALLGGVGASQLGLLSKKADAAPATEVARVTEAPTEPVATVAPPPVATAPPPATSSPPPPATTKPPPRPATEDDGLDEGVVGFDEVDLGDFSGPKAWALSVLAPPTGWQQRSGGVLVEPGEKGGTVELVAEPTKPGAFRLEWTCTEVELAANRRAATTAEKQAGLASGTPAFVYHLGVRQAGPAIGQVAGLKGAALWVSVFLEKGGPVQGLVYQSDGTKPAGELDVTAPTKGLALVGEFKVLRFAPGRDDLNITFEVGKRGWRVSVASSRREVWTHAQSWTAAKSAAAATAEAGGAWTPFAVVGAHQDGRGSGALSATLEKVGERDIDLAPRAVKPETEAGSPSDNVPITPRPRRTPAPQPQTEQPVGQPQPQPQPPPPPPPQGGRPPPRPGGGPGPGGGGPGPGGGGGRPR